MSEVFGTRKALDGREPLGVSKVRTIALVDADGPIWRAAAVADRDGRGAADAAADLDARLERIAAALGGARLVLALTEASDAAPCFRRRLWPGYKARRRGRRRPTHLAALRAHAAEAYDVRRAPGFEADDVLGALATGGDALFPAASADARPLGPSAARVIVSDDKDLLGAPGRHAALRRGGGARRFTIRRREADRRHLLLTLTGDPSDGYAGCPGVGPVRAAAALSGGPDWRAVLALFRRAGRSEADALLTARLARVLRAEDLTPERVAARRPILWTPDRLAVA